MLAVPYIQRAQILSGRLASAPELTYVSSCLWDAARWMRQDIEKGVSAETGLSEYDLRALHSNQ
jgi:hypothetical protein